jgi:hypothetical protein
VNEPEEEYTTCQLLGAIGKALWNIVRVGREHKELTRHPTAVREELADHLAGWITTAVRQHTGGRTDLSGARTWSDIAQRLQVAASLLADHTLGCRLNVARDWAVEGLIDIGHEDKERRWYGRRGFVSALLALRAAKQDTPPADAMDPSRNTHT